MKIFTKICALLMVASIGLSGCNKTEEKTVTFYGWGGSDQTNNYIDHYIADKVKDKYDINLKRVGMNIDDILNKLQNSVNAGQEDGNIDIIWINGENFYTAKKNNLLYGPFAEPAKDFGVDNEGYEAPFGRAELVMEYNSDKIGPIRNADELLKTAKENPGRITYPALPDFTGSAFVRNIIYEKVGYENIKDVDPSDKEAVKKAIEPAIAYLKEIKPYLWKEGKTYPSDITQMDTMFGQGELYFDISYNPNHAQSMIDKKSFPESTRTCLFDKGMIGNTHFLAIAKNSKHKEEAKKVIEEIESFDSQLEKYKPEVWGDLPIFDNSKLSEEEQKKLKSVDIGKATLSQEELSSKRMPELKANMIPVIEEIWQEEIPGK